MTLDLAALKVHLGADATLSDDTLEMLLDAAREAVDDYLGPAGDVTELITTRSTGPLLRLSRRATAVVSVIEGVITLDPLDYALRPSGRILVRLDTGPTPRWYWSGRVDVTYTPVPDLAAREAAMVALVKLDMNHQPGVVSSQIGDWSESYGSDTNPKYLDARAEILAGIHGAGAGIR